MRYYVRLHPGGESIACEVEALGPGRYALSTGGIRQEVDAQLLAHGDLSLLVGGTSYAVELQSVSGHLRVRVRGEPFLLEVVDERHHHLRPAGPDPSSDGPEVLRSPMPGKVVKLLVGPGDEVVEGQGLVVVEAMKMENELRAPRSGRVARIAVAEGAAVEGQAELLIIESTSASPPAR
jgi:biotin carboxyl carrier protein